MARLTRPPRFNPVQPTELPVDVRLANAAAALITVGVLATALVGAVLWVMRSPVFPVRSLAVSGELQHTTVASVRASVAPQLVGNFYSIDLQQARQVFETTPWVRRAVVRRVWPDGLAVQLEEHQPVALWRGLSDADGSTRLVNHQGEVFAAPITPAQAQDLPELAGPEGSSAPMLAMYRRLLPVLQALGQPKNAALSTHVSTDVSTVASTDTSTVASTDTGTDTGGDQPGSIEGLQLSVRGSWRVDLASGASIELGRGNEDQVAQRALRFVQTVAQATSPWQAPLEFADLRHSGGYAVRLRGVVPKANAAAGAAAVVPAAAVLPPVPTPIPTHTRAAAAIAVAQKN
jgi:cell division protein FtsQ